MIFIKKNTQFIQNTTRAKNKDILYACNIFDIEYIADLYVQDKSTCTCTMYLHL